MGNEDRGPPDQRVARQCHPTAVGPGAVRRQSVAVRAVVLVDHDHPSVSNDAGAQIMDVLKISRGRLVMQAQVRRPDARAIFNTSMIWAPASFETEGWS